MKAATADLDQGLVKALSHPLRAKVFAMLAERVASPSELAGELGEPLGNVAYHVQVLNKLGCLELVKTTPVRGAVEHHYRAVKRPFFSEADWAKMPASLRTAVCGGILSLIWEDTRAALKAGCFESRDDVHLSRTNLVLDEQGWEEVRELLDTVLDQAVEIEAKSSARLGKSKDGRPLSSKVMLMHFEAGPEKGKRG